MYNKDIEAIATTDANPQLDFSRRNGMTSFYDYCDDVLNLSAGLMTRAERDEAWESYLAVRKEAKKTRRSLNKKSLEARNVAKMFGGKVLTGSRKQKEWGEKIRAQKIEGMDADDAQAACDPNGMGRSAHFWIANRDREPAEIADFFKMQTELLRRYHQAREANDVSKVASIAEQYNELTTLWGFTND